MTSLAKENFVELLARAAAEVQQEGERITASEAVRRVGLPILDPNHCPISNVVYRQIKFPTETLMLLTAIDTAWAAYQKHLDQ